MLHSAAAVVRTGSGGKFQTFISAHVLVQPLNPVELPHYDMIFQNDCLMSNRV